jgi:hypothetical protein
MVGFKVLSQFIPPKRQTRGNAGAQRSEPKRRLTPKVSDAAWVVGLPKWSGQVGSPFFVFGWFARASLFFRGDISEFVKVYDAAPIRGATQEDE